MMKTIASAALIAAATLTSVAMFSVEANAREGSARSVGHGIKCRVQAVPQPDGTVKVQQVCYKGV